MATHIFAMCSSYNAIFNSSPSTNIQQISLVPYLPASCMSVLTLDWIIATCDRKQSSTYDNFVSELNTICDYLHNTCSQASFVILVSKSAICGKLCIHISYFGWWRPFHHQQITTLPGTSSVISVCSPKKPCGNQSMCLYSILNILILKTFFLSDTITGPSAVSVFQHS